MTERLKNRRCENFYVSRFYVSSYSSSLMNLVNE